MMKRFFCLLAVLALLPTLVSAAVMTDAAGRRVNVPDQPQRIVSLIPSIAETLFAIGAGGGLVAVTDYTNYPAAANRLPSVGSYTDPSLESILSYAPDLVIATTDGTPLALVQQLTRLDIPVFVISSHSVATALTAIEELGRITARQTAAQQLVADIRNRLAVIADRLAGRPRVRVLACVMLHPLTVSGPGTFVDDLLRRAGGINVVQPSPSRYPTWNRESLLVADPEAIILPLHPGQGDAHAYFNQWPQLQAVKKKHIFVIEADWIHRPGPRMILGVEALAQALYPDIFPDE